MPKLATSGRWTKRTLPRRTLFISFAASVVGGFGAFVAVGGTQGTPRRVATLPQPSQRCGQPDHPANTFGFRTADNVSLDGVEVGQGAKGVVLVHENGSRALCGWWPYAVSLADGGFHVLLFDMRCSGLSGCPKSYRR